MAAMPKSIDSAIFPNKVKELNTFYFLRAGNSKAITSTKHKINAKISIATA